MRCPYLSLKGEAVARSRSLALEQRLLLGLAATNAAETHALRSSQPPIRADVVYRFRVNNRGNAETTNNGVAKTRKRLR